MYPLDMEVNKRLIIDCSDFMLVNKVLKHLLGSRSQNTHIGPHLCPHPLGSCRNMRANLISVIICLCVKHYYIQVTLL